jgi:serine/threonine protein kinase
MSSKCSSDQTRDYEELRTIENFITLKEIGKGTYGCVYEGVDSRDGSRVALKRVLPKIDKEGFPITAVREIKALRMLTHPNVLRLLEVVYGKRKDPQERDSVFMVFPFIEHDLVGLQHYRRNEISLPETKCIALQILKGLEYLHSQGIVHRDLKLANLLLTNEGVLKIADFGLSRLLTSSAQNLTNKVVTRWYRPPELLLGATRYDNSVDIWSFGTILAELLIGFPLFPGESEVHVLRFIFDTLGPPNESLWSDLRNLSDNSRMMSDVAETRRRLEDFIDHPVGICRYDSRGERPVSLLVKDASANYLDRQVFNRIFRNISPQGLTLMVNLLQYDPNKRPDAATILMNRFFEEIPASCKPSKLNLCPEPRRELQVREGGRSYSPTTKKSRRDGNRSTCNQSKTLKRSNRHNTSIIFPHNL